MLRSLVTALVIGLGIGWSFGLAQAQTPNGYINPPIYGTGLIPEHKAGTVTTTIPASFNHPTNLVVYNISIINNWTVLLPNPAFDGQLITIACVTSVVTLTVQSTDGSALASGIPTTCGAATTFTLQWSSTYNIWYIATGTNTAAATSVINVRSLGLVCDGVTNDTTAWTAAVVAVNASSSPITLSFPGTCLISPATYTFSNLTSWVGTSGGGIKLTASPTLTGDLFVYSVITGAISVRDFTLNLNGAVASGTVGAFHWFGLDVDMEHSQIANGGTVTAGNALLLIEGYGLASCRFSYNTFSIVATSIYQSEAINLGSNGFPVKHCLISHNISTNTGFGIFFADDITIDSNEINKWGFGGGITLGPDLTTTTRNVVVTNNNIHDNTAVVDINGTSMSGIENWFYGASITSNRIRNTCGPGIGTGGRSTITGNTVINSGLCYSNNLFQNSGITATTDGTQTANGSTIDGNTVYDDGGGNTTYGYSDLSQITGVTLGINDFQGSSGAYNLLGTSTFVAPQTDNRLINACASIDQRHAGAPVNAGYSADGWKVAATTGALNVNSSNNYQIGPCTYALKVVNTSSITPGAGSFYVVGQSIPGSEVMDLGFDVNQAKTLILSFCAETTLTPPNTFSYYIQNLQSTYTYVGNYTIANAANIPQCFSFRVPVDTHFLNWANIPTAKLGLGFDLGSASTNKTPTLNTWTSGIFVGSTTASNFVSSTVNSVLVLTAIRFAPAGADEGYLPPTPQYELWRAQRFYQSSFPTGTAPAQNAGVTNAACAENPATTGFPSIPLRFTRPMNTAPAITLYNPSATNANWRDITASSDIGASASQIGTTSALIGSTASVSTGGDTLCIHWTADAGL